MLLSSKLAVGVMYVQVSFPVILLSILRYFVREVIRVSCCTWPYMHAGTSATSTSLREKKCRELRFGTHKLRDADHDVVECTKCPKCMWIFLH